MYHTLQKVLGQPVADTLMNHLPPGGWGDVARKADIDRITLRLDQIDQRFEQIDRRLDQLDFNVAGLAAMKRYVIGTGISLAGLICAFGIPALMYILQS